MARKRPAPAPAPLARVVAPTVDTILAAGVAYEACRQFAVANGDRTRQPWEFANAPARRAAFAQVEAVRAGTLPDAADTETRIFSSVVLALNT